MIDFRYHIVSLVAVFLALATGILLGAGPLSEPIQGQVQSQTDALRNDQQELRASNSTLQEGVALGDAYVSETRSAVVGSSLEGRRVVVLTLPAVEGSLRDQMVDTLEGAGAVVTGTVDLQPAYLEPDELAAAAEALAALGTPAPGSDTTPEAATLVAEALAAAVLTTVPPEQSAAGSQASPDGDVDGGAPEGTGGTSDGTGSEPGSGIDAPTPDDRAAAVLDALSEVGVLSVDGEPDAPANMVVVLASGVDTEAPTVEADAAAAARDTALVPLVAALDSAGRGAVVAGATSSAADGGFVQAVRADEDLLASVSTIDVAETSAGEVAVLLALLEQSRGEAGAYGLGADVDAVLPPLPGADPTSSTARSAASRPNGDEEP